ncbi:hypothetical protein GCM10027360_44950 [Amycolatopsis echigonensis]
MTGERGGGDWRGVVHRIAGRFRRGRRGRPVASETGWLGGGDNARAGLARDRSALFGRAVRGRRTFESFLPWSAVMSIQPYFLDGPEIWVAAGKNEQQWQRKQFTRWWRQDRLPAEPDPGQDPRRRRHLRLSPARPLLPAPGQPD